MSVVAARVAETPYVFDDDVPPFVRGAVRPAWVVVLEGSAGAVGAGEAVGWPGRLSLPDEEAVRRAAAVLMGLPVDIDGLVRSRELLDRPEIHPGAAWAAFVALARLVSSSTGLALAEVLGGSGMGKDVEVSGLLLDVRAPPPACRTLKAKVRSSSGMSGERELVAALARTRAPATLRLDGNHALSLTDALALAEAAGEAFAWLEEPVPPTELAAFGARASLALDESLAVGSFDDVRRLVDETAARALVLKPAVLGPARTFALAALAEDRGLPAVVSSVFEGARGLRALAALQAVFAPDVAAGIGTGRFLVGQDELVVVEGRAALSWREP